MAERLGLSKDTVRRDLAVIEEEDRRRRHGSDHLAAEVARVIADLVPGGAEDSVTVIVSVLRTRVESGGPWCESWTGTPQDLAQRILAEVSLTDERIEEILAAVRAVLVRRQRGGGQ
jgi:hypothetical protein